MAPSINRRTLLRGSMGAATIAVGLPFLDCFLNAHGTALAATGAPLPVAFGTWHQDLGLNPGRWVPAKTGAGYENNVELKVLDPIKHRVNIISGLQYFVDGRPIATHATPSQIATTGQIAVGEDNAASIDSLVADVIGTRTRFRSLEVSLDGTRKGWSKRKGTAYNPSEPSPAALYARIFGAEFKDPNAADFKPDVATLAKHSALSSVAEQRKAFMANVGAADRARLDEYFTSLRQIEQKLSVELEKPAPLAACAVPDKTEETTIGTLVDQAQTNSRLFSGLLAHALACGQTRVFNVSVGAQEWRRQGVPDTWHSFTHFEARDEQAGYQPDVGWFIDRANESFLELIQVLDGVKEGDGTLLDRLLVLRLTDHGYARIHSMDNIPMMTVGNAGGRLKTGIHYAGAGDPVTRLGLTVLQTMGVPANGWGTLSNFTTKPISEILA